LPHPEPSRFFLIFLVAASVIGLAFIPVLLLQPNLQADQLSFRQPLVGVIYIIVCFWGIVAVFYPGKCRMMFQKPGVFDDSERQVVSVEQFLGHHPECEEFSGNRITIGGSVFCAACSGLLIGAVTAMVGTVLFSLGFFSLRYGNLWVLAIGEILMFMGLTQVKMRGYLKVAVNALFVVGSYISLVVADLVGQSLSVDWYVLGLIIFMLWVRILLSEYHNKQTCLACRRCI
jgi:hypothetical protein